MYDPRWTASGLYTNLYAVESENGVYDILSGSPSYDHYVTAGSKETDLIRSWNRPTLGWSLDCEAQGKTR